MKSYMGDGVYVELNFADQLVLTTEDGIGVTNRIILEPEVWDALRDYVNQRSRRYPQGPRSQRLRNHPDVK